MHTANVVWFKQLHSKEKGRALWFLSEDFIKRTKSDREKRMLHNLMYMKDLLSKMNPEIQRTDWPSPEAGDRWPGTGWGRKMQTRSHKANGSEMQRAARWLRLVTLCGASERREEWTVSVLTTRKTSRLCVVMGVDSPWRAFPSARPH